MSSVFDSVDDISEKAIKQREVIRTIYDDLYDALELIEEITVDKDNEEDFKQAIDLIKKALDKLY